MLGAHVVVPALSVEGTVVRYNERSGGGVVHRHNRLDRGGTIGCGPDDFVVVEKDKRKAVWRNVLVAAITEGARFDVFGLDEGDGPRGDGFWEFMLGEWSGLARAFEDVEVTAAMWMGEVVASCRIERSPRILMYETGLQCDQTKLEVLSKIVVGADGKVLNL